MLGGEGFVINLAPETWFSGIYYNFGHKVTAVSWFIIPCTFVYQRKEPRLCRPVNIHFTRSVDAKWLLKEDANPQFGRHVAGFLNH